MPASSISNGHTGPLKFANSNDVAEYISLIRTGAEGTDCKQIARESIGRHLHVVEFWMPGGCNLHCKHCYVASWPERKALVSADYAELTNRMVRTGFVDVVIPGMEPLLRPETWVVTEAAHSAGSRSIGMTTNATLLKRRLKLVLDSPLTVINVSLDGPQAIHDDIRGKGVYKIAMDGVAALRKASRTVRIISNCTVNRLNLRSLPKVATLAGEYDLTFAAFHPFERSAEVDPLVA